MTDNELFLLAAGITIGAHLTLLGWIGCDFVAGRRADRRRKLGLPGKTKHPAPPRVDGPSPDEPHPAELLEASVRGFELNLLDCLDRVEGAARRDGQL